MSLNPLCLVLKRLKRNWVALISEEGEDGMSNIGSNEKGIAKYDAINPTEFNHASIQSEAFR
ncbi:MAG: hypothetical protein AMXMBFR17_29150 [Candidatus Jettenia caeni]|nr:MAG: hypothetical protein JETCAE04_09220 [Candidatus Jettenia caeni]